jgi:DNA-directed RNA polymerase subunit RPC12/RpoP
LQDQHTRLVAVCEVCGSHTCSAAGCSYTCARCSRALCRRHASVYANDEAYCSRCHPLALLRWLVLGKRR